MATYYIDYKNGNDTTGDGSSGAPYKTISKGLTVAGNNDTLLLRGTSATDEIHRVSGVTSSETGFTIAADTGHYPVVSGSVGYASWTLTADQTYTYETAYTPATCYMVWEGTTFYTSVASIAAVEATECTFYADLAGDLLYIHVAGGGPPGTLEVHAGNTVLTMSGTGATVRGVTFEHGLFNLILSGTNATVDQCTLQWPYHISTNASYGISVASTGALVKNCRFYNYHGRGINAGTGAGTLTVQDSLFVCSHSLAGTVKYYGVNLDVGTGHIVERCVIQGYADGVYVKSASTATVRYCTFINIQHAPAIWDNCDGAIGYNNISYYTADYADTAAFHYGFVLHNYGATYIYHNVFAWMNRRTEGNECGLHVSPKSGVQTLHGKNNIFYNCATGIHYDAGAGSVTYDLGYNAFYGNTNDFLSVDPGDQGTNNVTADPRFANPLAYDFRLLPGSPCIDAAIALPGYDDGYRGAAPDIGAIEYIAPLNYARIFAFFMAQVYEQAAAGTQTNTGTAVKLTATSKSGSQTNSGAIRRQAGKVAAGSQTNAGAISRHIATSEAGALPGAGGVVRETATSKTGAWSGLGAIVRRIGKLVAGVWTGTGEGSGTAPATGAIDLTLDTRSVALTLDTRTTSRR